MPGRAGSTVLKLEQPYTTIKMSGEEASSDEPSAAAFKPTLKKHTEECGYSAKQVINYDKTGLYWKMSSRTFIAKEEKTAPGFKTSRQINPGAGW